MKTKNNIIGDNIAWIRKEREISQQDLADDLQCSRQHISHLETGKRIPNRTMLVNIAEALSVDVEELLS